MPTRRTTQDREHGHILVIAAVGLLCLLVMAAFTVDVGNWYNKANKAQRAADAAALAAVTELNNYESEGYSRTEAETAGRAAAVAAAKQNGFDTANTRVTVNTSFAVNGASDQATVTVTEANVPLFFAGVVMKNVSIGRDAAAVMGDCQATCQGEIKIPPPLGTMIDTGTGGDGYMAVRAGNYLWNLFHHTSNNYLQCTDLLTNRECAPTGVNYPVMPYAATQTNYTPKLAAYGTRVYFIVQGATTVGLGCWDSDTHAKCNGFSSPVQLAAYKKNGSNNGVTRIDGPEVVGDRLYAYGDDNRMYCYDLDANALCWGYPRQTGLYGVRSMTLKTASEGIAGGVNNSGVQFDMLVHPNNRKIYTVIGPTTDGSSWVGCYDTAWWNLGPCTDWPTNGVSVDKGRRLLFFRYGTNGDMSSPTGVCARGGKLGGDDGTGHTCWSMTGTNPTTIPNLPWTFNGFGEQEATAPRTDGHLVTYFPDRAADKARCWDWNTGAACSIALSNWSGTDEYGYWWDGGGCIIGLGHAGRVWSFRVDDGLRPCEGNSAGGGILEACLCSDGATRVWTALTVSSDTDLTNFSAFRVTIKRPDGTTYIVVDLVTAPSPIIDLSPLNSEVPFPDYLTITAQAITLNGQATDAWFETGGPAVTMLGGSRATLIE